MPSLPNELDFSTPGGREATPERMNRAMGYLMARFKALESVVPEFETVIATLNATGIERLDEVLTPLLVSAQAMEGEITAIRDTLASPVWRDALVAETTAAAIAGSWNDPLLRAALIADVIAEIDTQDLYIRAADGTADVAMFTGADAPDNTLGKDGDLFVQHVP